MIEIFDNIEQGSDLWFEKRLGSVGSSSVKNAMAGGQGKTRKTLLYNLLAEKITGVKTCFKTTPAMQEGIDREQESLDYYQFHTGIDFEQVGLIGNSDFAGQHTSPDAINRELKIGLELKNPQANTMVRYLEADKMPTEYVAQCQHAMMISDYDCWHFMAYHPAFKTQLIKVVDRDEVYISRMREKMVLFFEEMKTLEEVVNGKSK